MVASSKRPLFYFTAAALLFAASCEPLSLGEVGQSFELSSAGFALADSVVIRNSDFAVSLESCAALCVVDEKCGAFQFEESQSSCTLGATAESGEPSDGVNLFRRVLPFSQSIQKKFWELALLGDLRCSWDKLQPRAKCQQPFRQVKVLSLAILSNFTEDCLNKAWKEPNCGGLVEIDGFSCSCANTNENAIMGTQSCSQAVIVDIQKSYYTLSCNHLSASRTPPLPPPPSSPKSHEIGCFPIGSFSKNTTFIRASIDERNLMTRSSCLSLCEPHHLAGIFAGNRCVCGSAVSQSAPKLSLNDCSIPCPGNASETCGGKRAMFVVSENPNFAVDEDPNSIGFEPRSIQLAVNLDTVDASSESSCCKVEGLFTNNGGYWSSRSVVRNFTAIKPDIIFSQQLSNGESPSLAPTLAPFGSIHSGESGVKVPDYWGLGDGEMFSGRSKTLPSNDTVGGELVGPQSVIVGTDNPSRVVWYTISIVREYLENAPLDWYLLGSNTLLDWWILDYQLNFSWEDTDTFTFKVKIPKKYMFYRLMVTDVQPFAFLKTVIIDEVYLYGFDTTESPTSEPTMSPTLVPTFNVASGPVNAKPNSTSESGESSVSLSIGLGSFGVSLAAIAACTFGFYYWRKMQHKSSSEKNNVNVDAGEYPGIPFESRTTDHWQDKGRSKSSKSSFSTLSIFGFKANRSSGEGQPSFTVTPQHRHSDRTSPIEFNLDDDGYSDHGSVSSVL